MWRPENWDAIETAKTVEGRSFQGVSQLDVDLIEAGATAYAKALIKEGIRFEPGVYAGGEEALFISVLQMRGIRAGHLVFIPDK
ncbi:hypothetical protein ES703_122209 [subsurface metagenome]